jgi:hypothetical protein
MISNIFVGHDSSGDLPSLQTDTEGAERRVWVAGAGDEGAARHRTRLAAVVLLLLGTLGVSTAFGMLLLLPLYVQQLGGNEANFGVVLSAATVTAVLCIGLLIRYPGALRPNMLVAIAIALYGLGRPGRRS